MDLLAHKTATEERKKKQIRCVATSSTMKQLPLYTNTHTQTHTRFYSIQITMLCLMIYISCVDVRVVARGVINLFVSKMIYVFMACDACSPIKDEKKRDDYLKRVVRNA